jgi:predicted transcriptional regulator
MKVQKLSNKHNDTTKLRIVKLLYFGITSCTDIAYILGISKAAVSQHVRSLNQLGYVDIVETRSRYQKKTYVMTQRGVALLVRLA